MPSCVCEHFTLQPMCQHGLGVGAQDQISGLWDPGHAFSATASFHSNLRHRVLACPPCSITRRSCHLRGHSLTWKRAASGVNREEPWGEIKAMGTRWCGKQQLLWIPSTQFSLNMWLFRIREGRPPPSMTPRRSVLEEPQNTFRARNFCTCFISLDMFSVSWFIIYGNLSRICILLLCENCINLNYVEWFIVLFRSTILFHIFILLILGSLLLKL